MLSFDQSYAFLQIFTGVPSLNKPKFPTVFWHQPIDNNLKIEMLGLKWSAKMYVCACACTNTDACFRIDEQMHTCMHVHLHAKRFCHMRQDQHNNHIVCKKSGIHMHMLILSLHTYTHTHAHTHTHTCTHPHQQPRTYQHTCILYWHTYVSIHTHGTPRHLDLRRRPSRCDGLRNHPTPC